MRNTNGTNNTGIGINALVNNTTSSNLTAVGANALLSNVVGGSSNTAVGANALSSNTGGYSNTAMGTDALSANVHGNGNIAVGYTAGSNLTTGSANIDIGNTGKAGESGKIRIGTQGIQNATFIAGIAGVTVTGSPVVVNSMGKLGVGNTSSARFKDAIKPMAQASEVILGLKPVTFRYKEEIDPDGIPQFGLVAEEVDKVAAQLVTRDEAGKPATVRYEAVNAMLLNEFLKARRQIDQQQEQIEALTVGLQKITAEVKTGQGNATRVAGGQ